jgi:hypothetical protein
MWSILCVRIYFFPEATNTIHCHIGVLDVAKNDAQEDHLVPLKIELNRTNLKLPKIIRYFIRRAALRYVTLRNVTLRYVTLRNVTLLYITLRKPILP